MADKQKITPRARRLAAGRGVNIEALNITGTGYGGGVSESDILIWLDSEEGGASPDVRATPLARAIARAEGISLSGIPAADGRKITKNDVLAAQSVAEAHAPASDSSREQLSETPGGKRIAGEIPYDGVRKIIGTRLAESKFTAPHLYFTQKVDLNELLPLRALINAKQEKKTSVTDYVARAVVLALQKYPEMNASLAGDVIEQYANVNLGIAVASPTGLIVPVIRNAQDLSVVELSKTAAPLFERARDGKLAPDEYQGGTFTISNLGMFGIENFTAIINPPEVGILAVSATKDEPAVVTDAGGGKSIEIRPLMNITLSVDHRLIDGLLAAQFVGEVKRLLESPVELLI
ncbi:MAG: 2-oxo acid dehydrogenase subunit E2 [Clostridiales Family XIII bacterium]|jgi:pyruvate dehydrogenase E2 component (dihydrolipoamide acetyltransferase)|nr:2-oxo acid dehydrogenase subunit E2 [Clostridiales Family XIII bacterium]